MKKQWFITKRASDKKRKLVTDFWCYKRYMNLLYEASHSNSVPWFLYLYLRTVKTGRNGVC